MFILTSVSVERSEYGLTLKVMLLLCLVLSLKTMVNKGTLLFFFDDIVSNLLCVSSDSQFC